MLEIEGPSRPMGTRSVESRETDLIYKILEVIRLARRDQSVEGANSQEPVADRQD